MKRDIKFRYIFKHIESGNIEVKKYYLSQMEEKPTKELSPCFAADYELLSRDQYTGRKDRNGLEIYEGDAVKRFVDTVWVMSDGAEKYCTWYVEFRYGAWIFRSTPISPSVSYPYFDSNARNMVIIGNIYENTKLLEMKE